MSCSQGEADILLSATYSLKANLEHKLGQEAAVETPRPGRVLDLSERGVHLARPALSRGSVDDTVHELGVDAESVGECKSLSKSDLVDSKNQAAVSGSKRFNSLVAHLDSDSLSTSTTRDNTTLPGHELHQSLSELGCNRVGRSVHDSQSSSLGASHTARHWSIKHEYRLVGLGVNIIGNASSSSWVESRVVYEEGVSVRLAAWSG